MTNLQAGDKTSITVNSGETYMIECDAVASGQIYYISPGGQPITAQAITAGKDIRLGPYAAPINAKIVCDAGSVTITKNSDIMNFSQLMGNITKTVSASTYTLSDNDHGVMLLFAGECTVTVPKQLRFDFCCGWSQESASVITFEAASGVTIHSVGDGLATTDQYSIGGLIAFAQDTFRLTGV
jgi:hypothetical protein